MNELPVPLVNHQLSHVRALIAFGYQYQEDPQAARAAASQVFGLDGGLTDELLLSAMQLLSLRLLPQAREVLTHAALGDPGKIKAVYDILASVFKYVTVGMPMAELVGYAIEPMRQIYRAYPGHPAAQAAMLDMLLYLGLPSQCEQVLAQAGPQRYPAEAAELAAYRARLAHYRDECRLSVVLLTYRRPKLLRHTLRALRAALAETDVEVIVGVNDDLAETRQVLRDEPVNRVLFSSEGNIGIEFYKQVFAAACGEYIIEIDDDIARLPDGFDRQLIDSLNALPNLGLVGHWPIGFIDAQNGAAIDPAPRVHLDGCVAGLPFGLGAVAGACAGMRRKDFLAINGFSRGTLSHLTGEEPQLIRKLALHGKLSGVIFDQGLQVYQNG